MPFPRLSDKQVDQLAGFVASYIKDQRAAFGKNAQPIQADHIQQLQAFFPADVLSAVKVVQGRALSQGFMRSCV